MLMNASPQVHVVQVTCVTTPLDHTDVNVHWGLLMLQAHRIHWIQSVWVRKPFCFFFFFSVLSVKFKTYLFIISLCLKGTMTH